MPRGKFILPTWRPKEFLSSSLHSCPLFSSLREDKHGGQTDGRTDPVRRTYFAAAAPFEDPRRFLPLSVGERDR